MTLLRASRICSTTPARHLDELAVAWGEVRLALAELRELAARRGAALLDADPRTARQIP